MTKRTEKTGGTQGANTEATALARLLAPLVDGMTTTRHQLLTWVQSAGLVALDAVFREEAAALAGPKGRHEPTRTHHHWGATPRQLTFGGRQLSLSCPRVRSREGQEAALPSVLAGIHCCLPFNRSVRKLPLIASATPASLARTSGSAGPACGRSTA